MFIQTLLMIHVFPNQSQCKTYVQIPDKRNEQRWCTDHHKIAYSIQLYIHFGTQLELNNMKYTHVHTEQEDRGCCILYRP